MYNFETISQGSTSYLVLRLDEADSIDELAVGMMRNNQIPGLLPMTKRWEKKGFALYYTISSLTPLSQCYAVLGSENRLLKFLLDYCSLVKECEEYLLEPSKLILDENYVFVKATTGAPFVPYLALMEQQDSIDVTSFFNQFVHRVESHLPPESHIRPILYEQSFHGTFDPKALLDALSSLNGTDHRRPQEIPQMQRETHAAARHYQDGRQLAGVVASQIPVLPHSEVVRPATPVLPQPELVQPATPVPNANAKQGRGFLGFGGPKTEKKKKGKKAAGKPVKGTGIDNPFVPPQVAPEHPQVPNEVKAPEVVGKPKKRSFWEKKPSVKPMAVPGAADDTPQKLPGAVQGVQELPPIPERETAPRQDGGYTINLNPLDSGVPGGTIRMSEGSDNDALGGTGVVSMPTLWLVRRGTQERIQITHSNFHVGRMLGDDEIVDYAVLVSTGYMGADHAYFQIKDGVFYLIDNNSTNGTWLNGQKLQPSTPFAVRAGDIVKMADITFDLSEH